MAITLDLEALASIRGKATREERDGSIRDPQSTAGDAQETASNLTLARRNFLSLAGEIGEKKEERRKREQDRHCWLIGESPAQERRYLHVESGDIPG